jgi:diguanylate cyclase (GGDEF)-like protein
VVSAFSIAVFFSIGFLFAGPAAGAESAKKAPARLRTLTTARQAHDLSSEEAKRGYPIHLRGVVTYFDPSIGSRRAALFVHDATGSIYAEIAEGSTGDLPPGTLIEVRGVSGAGEFAPIVARPQIRVIGHSSLPANPRRESLTGLATGAEDGQWVEAEGLIHSIVEYGHNVTLQLAMPGGTATVVMVKEAGANYSGLVDAKVRIHANAGPTFNTSRQMIGVRLMCPNLSAIEIMEPPPGDSFQLPILPIDKLLRWDQINASFHRVHLRGRVTLLWPGSSLCIRDATRGICARTAQDTPVAVGDDVDVVGFAAAEDGAPVLTEAEFRSAATSGPVAALPVTAEQALRGKHDSELIQIDGQLIGSDLASSDITLLLTSGKNIFTVILPKSLAEPDVNAWKNGSVLRVTGICSIRLDTQKSAIGEGMAVPKSFRVLMRSPRDVAVLESPSWWTAGHSLALLALAIIITLLVLGWVAALRKQVEQQTVLLRESEQRFRHMALHDALTGLATRLLLQDRLYAAVETANRHLTGLALLAVDLDKFKEVNDRFGHQAGDEVLRVTALRLLETVRKSDTVARMGGDEFVVLLPDLSDPHAAEKIAANIVQTLAIPIPFEGIEILISVSVGVCSASAGQLAAEALLKGADSALYHAKASGGNCYQVFTPEMADVLVINAI